jgi:hypothetical protein
MPSAAGRSSWTRLFAIASDLLQQVRVNAGAYPIEWSFGGGTALMLQIGHRESHDIDIFIDDPQILGFLDPAKSDLQFIEAPVDYAGDGARFQRFAFGGAGEIDFIVSANLTSNPSRAAKIEGQEVQLETVAEIIAKKIYHRGREAKPRDIFDIAAAAQSHRPEIVLALRALRDQAEATLLRLDELNPQFVASTIEQLMILPKYAALVPDSLAIARSVLREATA